MSIVICKNGEGDNSQFWIYFGPFEGARHAKMWLTLVHLANNKNAWCVKGESQHRIITLAKIE